MEAGHGAARDRDEQQRDERRHVVRQRGVHRRRDDRRVRQEHGEEEDAQPDEELQPVDVVPGLKQQPDGEERRDRRVREEEDDPEARLGERPEARLGQAQRHLDADEHRPVEKRDADDRGPQERDTLAVEQIADRDRHRDDEPRGDDASRIVHEEIRDDDREDGVHHQEKQEDHDHEEAARPLSDDGLGERSDRLALVPHARPQRPGVVDAREEYGAERDPQERGQPSPHHRDGRPDDRCRARHGGEVVAPQHPLVRGHEVHPVFLHVRGRPEIRAQLEYPLRDEARVEEVSHGECTEAHHHQTDRAHSSPP